MRHTPTVLSSATLCCLAACAGRAVEDHPHATLRAYAAAIRTNNPKAAYQLLDNATRRKVSEPEFRRNWSDSRRELQAQALLLDTLLKEPVKLEAHLSGKNGVGHGLVFEKGRWHLGTLGIRQRANTPQEAVLALLRAAEARNYHALRRLMTTRVGLAFEREITTRIGKVRAALKGGISMRNGRAYLRAGSYKLELVKENGQWRVYDFD